MASCGAFWGITGVLMLLGSAVYRLTPLALEAFSYDLLWYHWMSVALAVLLMAYAEGYRGFQQRFSPRVAARAKYLKGHPRMLLIILSPLFCMGFFHATRRRKITSFSVTAAIVGLILLVRLLPQPWRGIVDAGVVTGLIWGIVSLLFFSLSAFTSENFSYSPEVPGEEDSSRRT
jgi:FtsH-binding integral membrane protein